MIALAGSNPALSIPPYGRPRIYVGLHPKHRYAGSRRTACERCGTEIHVPAREWPGYLLLCRECADQEHTTGIGRAMRGLVKIVGTRFWRRPT